MQTDFMSGESNSVWCVFFRLILLLILLHFPKVSTHYRLGIILERKKRKVLRQKELESTPLNNSWQQLPGVSGKKPLLFAAEPAPPVMRISLVIAGVGGDST